MSEPTNPPSDDGLDATQAMPSAGSSADPTRPDAAHGTSSGHGDRPSGGTAASGNSGGTRPPHLLGGRYEVGELIGRGGMADVYLGRDTRLGRSVAIKMLRSDLARDAGFLTRFRREAQSAAGLTHPAIVAIFDSGEDVIPSNGPGEATTIPYIIMEHVDGETLRDKLNAQGRLDPPEAMRVTEGVLDALAFSHSRGIVHRDIKPANVMITQNGHVKVMDFGIARAIADTAATMTHTSSVIGTAQYLSPEQATGQTVDERSDLYSTGCMLFELLTGRPPFTGDSPVAIAYQHVGEQPPAPSDLVEAIGGDLDAVTLLSLAKDRDARYQSAGDFRDDLANVRQGRPISPAALAFAGGAGAGALTQTMPPGQSAAATQVQPVIPAGGRHENTAGLPAVGRDEDEVPSRRDRREDKGGGAKAALITLLVIALLGGAGFAAFKLFGNQTPPVTKVSVPPLKGLTPEAAERALTLKGLVGKEVQQASDEEEGKVFAQNPEAGQSVDKNSIVNYTVSSGPDAITVPDVTGKKNDAAQKELTDAGFVVSKVQQANELGAQDQKAGEVLRTSPAAGSTGKKGDLVEIVVATGNMQVPSDLVGQDWSIVSNKLVAAGVTPKKQDVESDQSAGTVLEVEKAGQVVKIGSELTVKVAIKTPQTQTTTIIKTETFTPPPPPTQTETPTPTTTPPPPSLPGDDDEN